MREPHRSGLLILAGALVLAVAPSGCSDPASAEAEAPTYYGAAKAIVDAKCATCHRPGDIAPFSLTSYDDVARFAGPVRAAIANGTMPPWQPSDECNRYRGNYDLTPGEKETLLAWLDADTPPGDPADAPAPPREETGFEADISLQLPEAYTPTREPDDYRCQLIPWPAKEPRFVTGLRVVPSQRPIVHHVIVFLAGPEEVEQFRAYDDAEAGPGYTCYGGPRASTAGGGLGDINPATVLAALNELGLTPADLQSGKLTPEQFSALTDKLGLGLGGFQNLGSWVPGAPNRPYPEGTGIRVEPGSMIVAQVHYNTLSSAPAADQSVIEIATTTSVEREATLLPAFDIGWLSNGRLGGAAMTIPAGDANVEHSTTIDFDSPLVGTARAALGLGADAPLRIHTANHHMHELGTSQRSEIRHSDGRTSCLLDIPEWDFHWQGSYALDEPVTLSAGDRLWMGCTWDNSAANQPIIDGKARQPADVAWGEGTSDEMCLAGFYVTGE